MCCIDPAKSLLLVVDLQQRLMPAIDGAEAINANALKLLQSAALMTMPTAATEQLPERLGATLPEIQAHQPGPVFKKSSFDACRDPRLLEAIKEHRDIVVIGAETHVCVLQTVLSLLQQQHRVYVVADACGSRTAANKQAGLDRMAAAGATIVSTEMVIFEWLQDAQHAKFREVLALIK